jgi:ArsR family transcriptional regulator, arsenate/arsenite/antimonite-responsive transcriptional repressor
MQSDIEKPSPCCGSDTLSPAVAAVGVSQASRFFKALGDEMRLRIVALLSHGELCVCHIEEALGLSQSNVSHHLSVLRNAGIVEPHRNGKWVYYRVSTQVDDVCREQLRCLIASYQQYDGLTEEVERLLRSKGVISCRTPPEDISSLVG